MHSHYKSNAQDDSLAQLVEHNTFNVGVLGSSPRRITKRKAKRRQQKDKSYKINILWDFFLLSFGDLDRQKEGIDGQKLVPNSYPPTIFSKKGYDLSEIGGTLSGFGDPAFISL